MKGEDLFLEGDDFTNVQPAVAIPEGRRRDGGHIGCPLSWFKLVFPIVRGKNELAVALHIYRLRVIRRSRTIAVSNTLLAELGIDRFAKYRALRRLAEAGIITVKRRCRGSLEVRFRERKR